MNVENDLIRAYFEANGFWVKRYEPSSLLLQNKFPFPLFEIFNPINSGNEQEVSFRLFTGDLVRVNAAVVCLIGWHDSNFSSDIFTSDSRLLKFFRKQVDSPKLSWITEGVSIFPQEKRSLLIVPALPKTEGKTKELFELLKKVGIQGVLTMGSVLENLMRKSSGSPDIRDNSTFHLLKLLKVYGLATEPQLDIFNT